MWRSTLPAHELLPHRQLDVVWSLAAAKQVDVELYAVAVDGSADEPFRLSSFNNLTSVMDINVTVNAPHSVATFLALKTIEGTLGFKFTNVTMNQSAVALPAFAMLQSIGAGICIRDVDADPASIALDISPLSHVGIAGSCYVSPAFKISVCPCRSGCNDIRACGGQP